MNVSFDGLRLNIVAEQRELFEAVEKESEKGWADEPVDFFAIKEKLDDLTAFLGALVSCYDDDNRHDFNDLSKDGDMKTFRSANNG